MTAFNVRRAERDYCRSCGADVVWGVTVHGKPMPVDAAPALDGTGNIRLTAEEHLGINPRATVLGPAKATAAREAGEQLHRAHHSTCRNAELHRKRRTRR